MENGVEIGGSTDSPVRFVGEVTGFRGVGLSQLITLLSICSSLSKYEILGSFVL